MKHIIRTSSQLASTIQRERKKAALTQKSLSEKSGLRQATLSKIESGESKVQLQTLLNLLSALNLEIVIQPRSAFKTDDIDKVF